LAPKTAGGLTAAAVDDLAVPALPAPATASETTSANTPVSPAMPRTARCCTLLTSSLRRDGWLAHDALGGAYLRAVDTVSLVAAVASSDITNMS